MARARLTVALLTLSTSLPALAQQGPNDPGLPHSLIIGSADIDSTGQFQSIDIPVYAVTDDSVALYNICMRWRAPLGGVSGTGITYFYPLTDWEVRFDSVAMGDSSIGAFGFYDMPGGGSPPPIFTGYARMWIMSYRFVISPDVPRQTGVLDTFPVGISQASRFNSSIPRF